MPKRESTFREYLEALVIAAIFLGFTNTFVVKTFYIPSSSMEETLLVGDHLFVNRFIYGPSPEGWAQSVLPSRPVQRGDVVIFRSPERPRVDMVKRCIGVPGDTIRMVGKEVTINGNVLNDAEFAIHRDPGIDRRRDNFGPYTVPADHYFCLGDNRDRSWDSRYWGPVPAHFVKGRAFLVYWSFGGETPDGSWHGFGQKLRQLGKTASGFVTRTRWDRTFALIR